MQDERKHLADLVDEEPAGAVRADGAARGQFEEDLREGPLGYLGELAETCFTHGPALVGGAEDGSVDGLEARLKAFG